MAKNSMERPNFDDDGYMDEHTGEAEELQETVRQLQATVADQEKRISALEEFVRDYDKSVL